MHGLPFMHYCKHGDFSTDKYFSQKEGLFGKSIIFFENRHKIIMITVNTKEESLLKKGELSRAVATLKERGIP
jgi:hypothetical protein